MKAPLLTFVLYAYVVLLQSPSAAVGHTHGTILGRSVSSNHAGHAATSESHDGTSCLGSRSPLHGSLWPLPPSEISVEDASVGCLHNRASSIDIIRERRISSIIGALNSPDNNISAWLATLGSNGKWPDSEINYTTGCEAQRANWPAQVHWLRIVVLAAAWHGGLEGGEQYVKSATLRASISLAVNYWFNRDFTDVACLGSGGTAACPCDNPNNYLWNTNWFSNVILIPDLVGQTCLLLGDTLSSSQLNVCLRMTTRSYYYDVDGMTGANALDVASIGKDQALLTSNTTLLTDAHRRAHLELKVMNGVRADGIRADGAFGQHDGMIYNGNYGKDYTNDILGFELDAAGTEFSASSDSKTAFGTLFDGNSWMIFRNALTGVLHWDFSVLGRFISFPVIDAQATGSIKMNLTAIGELGRQWQSQPLINFESSLSKPSSNANAGGLQGNRMFYTNDYMVHRGQSYVATVKMWSTRTRHTECTNSQNPLGFHLADGVLYTYLQGNEYEDISVAWDWNLIPGITTDYGATALTCANSHLLGVEAFVGGASDGRVGVAAMRYTNPSTRALRWQKAWFFLDGDVQHVMISGLSSTSKAPVYSVLDQRRRSGSVFVDGKEQQTSNYSAARLLWHGGVGYKFSDNGTALSVQVGKKTGDWSKIGTSTQPPATVDLFATWISHKSLTSPIAYTIFPGTTLDSFTTKSSQLQLQSVQNDAHVSAVFDGAHNTLMAVFWDGAGGSVTLQPALTVSVNGNAAVIYRIQTGDVTVSDPSQGRSSTTVTITMQGVKKTLTFALPQGGLAGSSVTKNAQF